MYLERSHVLTTVQEKGVEYAIQSIYRDLEYAKSLIKVKTGKNAQLDDDETEESWTFVGADEPDPDLVTEKLSKGLGSVGTSSGKPSGRLAIRANS